MISPAQVMDEKRAMEDTHIQTLEKLMDRAIVDAVSLNQTIASVNVEKYSPGVIHQLQELVKQYRLEGWDAKYSPGSGFTVDVSKFQRKL